MSLRPDLTVAAVVERDGKFLLVEERVGNRMNFLTKLFKRPDPIRDPAALARDIEDGLVTASVGAG